MSIPSKERDFGVPSTPVLLWRLGKALVMFPVAYPLYLLKEKREQKRREQEWAALAETATHRCKECGALWRFWPEADENHQWQLCQPTSLRCCGWGEKKGAQMEPIEDYRRRREAEMAQQYHEERTRQ